MTDGADTERDRGGMTRLERTLMAAGLVLGAATIAVVIAGRLDASVAIAGLF